MTPVFIASDNIISPLGNTAAANFAQLKQGASGIRLHEDHALAPDPFFASLFFKDLTLFADQSTTAFSRFEQLLIASVSEALKDSTIDLADPETILILSSTKGNIGILETPCLKDEDLESKAFQDAVSLPHSAKKIGRHFNAESQPLVVSNACISGLLALLTGLRLIRSGRYKHAVVAGCDLITQFILSGFQSFQAISPQPCKPFDADRDGITLGEAAATIVLSSDEKYSNNTRLLSGSVSNDANHISGPSRTGEELFQAIERSMAEAGINSDQIDFISAHGTATLYNDEMEAKAIALAGMQDVPVNSLKGNYGHTLGAAGLIESVISLHALQDRVVLPTAGFNRSGVSKPLHICRTLEPLKRADHFLKTASGFGGCNAALVFGR